MNVLFCTLSYYPAVTGGAERQARLQAEELVRRGHRVTVVCARMDGLRSEQINGVRVVRLRRINRRHLFRISYLARLLGWLVVHNGGYDLTHVHLANLQADIAVAAARLRRQPVYVKVACGGAVGEVQRFSSMGKLTRWYGLRHAERVQVLSDEIARELTSIGVHPERMVKIPNAIDLEEFVPLSAEARRRMRDELGLPSRGAIVLFVGRLVDYKGIHDLFAAWRRLRHVNACLVLVGATDAQPLGAPPGVLVRDWADSVLPYLQAADVFVYPSHADGMSNAVLEAMACGCALVATEHGGTSEFLTAERDALLVAVRNPGALAAALDRVVTDADLRGRLAANARLSVSRYALGRIVDRIETEYRLVLARAGPQAIDRRPADRTTTGSAAADEAAIRS